MVNYTICARCLLTISASYVSTAASSGSNGTIFFQGLQLVAEAIAGCPRLVVLGEPGSGKSTALRYLALTLAKAGLDSTFDLAKHLEGWDTLGEQGRLLPIFLPLLPLAKRLAVQPNHTGNADDLWNYLAEHLEANGRARGWRRRCIAS